jgi:hypothetical protein
MNNKRKMKKKKIESASFQLHPSAQRLLLWSHPAVHTCLLLAHAGQLVLKTLKARMGSPSKKF